MKKKENKKFEMIKLSILKKTKGGTGDILTDNNDSGTITNLIKK